MDPPPLRDRVLSASRAIVKGCFAERPTGDATPPLVLCARHKAVAIAAELDVLLVHEETVLAQLTSIRDAAIASGRSVEEVSAVFEARVSKVKRAAAEKCVALQTEAVAADAALESALAAVAALEEAAATLDDAALFEITPALLAREAAARAAVAAIPVSPRTSGFIGLTDARPSSGSADGTFGRVLQAHPVTHLVHNPHCNHSPMAAGAVWNAAYYNDLAALQAALAAGGSTEEMNVSNETAIFYPAKRGDIDILHTLIAAGANTAAKSSAGWTVLQWAMFNKHAHVMRIILTSPNPGLSEEDEKGHTPLQSVALFGSTSELMELLLAHPAVDVNQANKKGLTALHIAVSGYNETAVSLLLADPRVDVNARDRVGLTPLHVAAQVGRAASVRLLLADARVDVAATSRGGMTALGLAEAAGKASVVALLRSRGCPR